MKKYLMMLLAAVTMVATSFTTVSCGNDDDDEVKDTYTISATVNTGNMPSDEASLLKLVVLNTEGSVTTTLSDAKERFRVAMITQGSSFQSSIDGFKNLGYKGISITVYLKDSKGNIIDSKTFS